MLCVLLLRIAAATLPLTDEVFLADADVRRDYPEVRGELRGACAVRDSATPYYRLTYVDEDAEGYEYPHTVCAWRPWRVGTFLAWQGDECDCDGDPRDNPITLAST